MTAQVLIATCRDCGAAIPELEVFPGPRCLSCHARKFDLRVRLTGAQPKPDFVGALNIRTRRGKQGRP